MIGSVKPLASLTSGLLARKGQARPAMRPQGFANLSPAAIEDLGWNDMGTEPAAPPSVAPAAPVALSPVEPPSVLVEREALREQVEQPVATSAPAEPATPSVSIATARRIGRESAAQTARGKAAFTLRLESERHLRLRLASAVLHESAQALVTRALDQFLATLPDVDALAAQIPLKKASR